MTEDKRDWVDKAADAIKDSVNDGTSDFGDGDGGTHPDYAAIIRRHAPVVDTPKFFGTPNKNYVLVEWKILAALESKLEAIRANTATECVESSDPNYRLATECLALLKGVK
jgi:hypothetical protein